MRPPLAGHDLRRQPSVRSVSSVLLAQNLDRQANVPSSGKIRGSTPAAAALRPQISVRKILMSTINRIQSELKSIEQGKFQKLCDAYLHRRGYEHITPLGAVTGADKTKPGRPDTLIATPEGTFILVEATTTQGKGLLPKLQSDLTDCFDVEKTGIEISEIAEVILCFNSDIDATAQKALREQGKSNGCVVSFFNMGRLSHDLYQKYPGLAKEFLGVSVDTGQVLSAGDFIVQYGKPAFATPLNTSFRFRKEVLKKVGDALETQELVLLTGAPGVGKTRLALQCCTDFVKQHPETRIFCILDRSIDIFEDTRNYFSAPGNYLILVDDANRTSRFDYFIHLIQDKRPDRTIKIIATVRDYALDKVLIDTQKCGEIAPITLKRLQSNEIEELVRQEFNITNSVYLTQIAEISQGNPRLAVMAAQVAVRENTIESILDVSSLYDQYFASIRKDVEEAESDDIIAVAATIAFFRSVDRSNTEIAEIIETHFGLTPEIFWLAVKELHRIEAVDLYENDIVKISDQVLATYFFYRAFFRDKVLDCSPLVIELFPSYRERVVEALNPCLNAFDADLITETLRPAVEQADTSLKDRFDDLMEFYRAFWFINPTIVLLRIRAGIDQLEPEPAPADLQFEPESGTRPSVLLSVLACLRFTERDLAQMALDTLLDYVQKRPATTPAVLHTLVQDFGFRRNSHAYSYHIEHAVITKLRKRSEEGVNIFFARLFIATAKHFLKTEHETARSENTRAVTLAWFVLPLTEGLKVLRTCIWEHLFALYEKEELQAEVLDALGPDTGFRQFDSAKEILEFDATHVRPFLFSRLDLNTFMHCSVASKYLEQLSLAGVAYDKALEQQLTSPTFHIARALSPDFSERRGSDRNGWERRHLERLKDMTGHYSRSDYRDFLDRCVTVTRQNESGHLGWEVMESIYKVLDLLEKRDTVLLPVVVEDYLATGNPLHLERHGVGRIIRSLLDCRDTDRAYAIISVPDYPGKHGWLLSYQAVLRMDEVSPEDVARIRELYRDADQHHLFYGMDHFQKYRQYEPMLPCQVAEIILERAKQEPYIGRCFAGLFNRHSDAAKDLTGFFNNETNLLKRIYFATLPTDNHVDYDGVGFDVLLDADTTFGREYIRWLFSQKELPSRHDDSRQYSFIWKRDDAEQAVDNLLEEIFVCEKYPEMSRLASVFFVPQGGRQAPNDLSERQQEFLQDVIQRKCQNIDYMRFLFCSIGEFDPRNRRDLIKVFLESNPRFEDFQHLPLEPTHWTWSGSEAPVVQQGIDFVESLLPLCNSVDLLEHRDYIERHIQGLHRWKEQAKREDFVRDMT